jgi:hypothetical protein
MYATVQNIASVECDSSQPERATNETGARRTNETTKECAQELTRKRYFLRHAELDQIYLHRRDMGQTEEGGRDE